MKLAEAIRLGGVLSTRQAQGIFLAVDGGTCALGGAALALGMDIATRDAFGESPVYQLMRKEFPELMMRLSDEWCPVCRQPALRNPFHSQGLEDAIIHLNDGHGWTRDQIADFVESLVPPAPVEPAIEAAECAAALEVPA